MMVRFMFKNYRIRMGLTQEKLSELVGIDIRSYQDIEANRTIPLTNNFAKIAIALKLSDEEIINELLKCSNIDKKKGRKVEV